MTLKQLLELKMHRGYKFILMFEILGLEHALVNNYVFNDWDTASNEADHQLKNFGRESVILDIDAPIKEGWSQLEEVASVPILNF